MFWFLYSQTKRQCYAEFLAHFIQFRNLLCGYVVHGYWLNTQHRFELRVANTLTN